MHPNKKGFSLIEMLVAMAVSSIIVAATYASFELVKNQYTKNIDVAEMHTSGRAIMNMMERDFRMAGFEFRDATGVITYGPITGPFVITDSGDNCCDQVIIINDDVTETLDINGAVISNDVERIQTRFWTVGFNSLKYGDRFRLFRQTNILGRNSVILGTPIPGNIEIMADFVEDFQLINPNSTVEILLLLRTKGQYGNNRVFEPEEYHIGNFNSNRTDRFMRDTFTSTILLRNL